MDQDREIALLNRLRGGQTQAEFADTWGISRAMISRLLSGERRAGRGLVIALIAAYPDYSSEITAAFLAKEEEVMS